MLIWPTLVALLIYEPIEPVQSITNAKSRTELCWLNVDFSNIAQSIILKTKTILKVLSE